MLLVRDLLSCCFGQSPEINHWISVRLTGGPVQPILGRTCSVIGTFHVEEIRDHGVLIGIYRMEVEAVEDDHRTHE